jgi:putative flippase GtrA
MGSASRASGVPDRRTVMMSMLGQGMRFALSGGVVALVYLGTTTVLADVAGLAFQAALAIGFCIGLSVHFTLQRVFVWTHHQEFALPLHHQLGRYLAAASAQYGVTAASTAVLPSALGVPTEVVYLATAAVVFSSNFLLFRTRIFHHKPEATGSEMATSLGRARGAEQSASEESGA